MLGRWRPNGKVAVATNRGVSACAVLDAVGLLPCVDLVVTMRDVRRPKPCPDVLFHALAYFERSPQEAIYVGDADLDREAAARAGVPFLGFRRPDPPSAHSPQEVERFLGALAEGEACSTLQATTTISRGERRKTQ